MRQQCDCPKLPAHDPRSTIAYMRQLVAEKRALEEPITRKPSVAMLAVPPSVTANTGK